MADNPKISVLFVCLGNICRSPLATELFRSIVNQRGLADKFDRIEGAGTAGYHVGETHDERTIDVLQKHGVSISSRAQQVKRRHFSEFDYILAMDKSNLSALRSLQQSVKKEDTAKAVVRMFGEYQDGREVPDPYYGGDEGFEQVYQQCHRYCDAFLKSLGFEE
ncbi:protein-tyrosine phosphatase [Atractiella rhizophila]|nr:protein-tyrosine phosphatase [Atractiella rhizophila]